MTATVGPDSLLTLHYRLATDEDVELVGTFSGPPSTLKMGSGELAPMLERCLDGLPVGARTVFLLDPEQGFGPHNPQLVQRLGRADLPANAPLELHGVIEFAGPDGAKFAGRIRELDDETALIDFNHPLAGRRIRFEVEIIGIL